LAATQGLVAFVALPLVGIGVDRFGTRALLVAAFCAQPLHALVLSLVDKYGWLLLPRVFLFFSWAILEVAGVLFVTSLTIERRRGTAQFLYMGVQVLGNLIGFSLAGFLAENFGYVFMYRVRSGTAAAGPAVFAAILLQCRRKPTNGREV